MLHRETGAIAWFETEADAKRAGYRAKLSNQEVQTIATMTRQQRRAWERKRAKQERKQMKKSGAVR